jgi:hypothetical protein
VHMPGWRPSTADLDQDFHVVLASPGAARTRPPTWRPQNATGRLPLYNLDTCHRQLTAVRRAAPEHTARSELPSGPRPGFHDPPVDDDEALPSRFLGVLILVVGGLLALVGCIIQLSRGSAASRLFDDVRARIGLEILIIADSARCGESDTLERD